MSTVARGAGRPSRRRRWIAFALALVLSSLVASVVLARWLRGDEGRLWLATRIAETISGQIRGRLTIAGIDDIDLERVVAHGVRFVDEAGRPVIEADAVELSYELAPLARGQVVSRAGVVHGGRVLLETDESGALRIDRAFRSSHVGPPGAPSGDDVVHLENLVVDDVVVVVAIGSAPQATVRRVGATVLVRAPDGGAAIVAAEHARGAIHVDAAVPFDLRFLAASIDVDGAARRRVGIDLPSRMGHERIGVTIVATAQADDTLHVDVHIRPRGASAALAATSMIGQALIAETQLDALDVTVELR